MLDEVKAGILEGQQAATAASTLILSAARVAREGGVVAGNVTEGVQHEFVQMTFKNLGEALHEADLVLRRLKASDEQAEEYLRKIG